MSAPTLAVPPQEATVTTATTAHPGAHPAATRSTRRRVVLTLVAGGSLAVLGCYGGAASAYWTAGGTGTGTAVTAQAPTITAVTTAAGGLYPGATTTLPVTVSNPGDTALTLASVTPGTVTSATPGCTAFVAATAPAVLPVVPAHGSVTVQVTVTMGLAAANACQGAAFGVPVALTATS